MKVIIYFLLLQVVIFSEAKKLREITYYEYYPVITEKIKTGMEIQIIKGYCVIFENKCSNFLYIPNKIIDFFCTPIPPSSAIFQITF